LGVPYIFLTSLGKLKNLCFMWDRWHLYIQLTRKKRRSTWYFIFDDVIYILTHFSKIILFFLKAWPSTFHFRMKTLTSEMKLLPPKVCPSINNVSSGIPMCVRAVVCVCGCVWMMINTDVLALFDIEWKDLLLPSFWYQIRNLAPYCRQN